MPLFDDLKTHYPTQSKDQLFDDLGGQWPSLKNNPNYRNTCAIRLSVAFYKSGISVPSKFQEAISGAGDSIIVKVRTMKEFIEAKYGGPFWGMSKSPGTQIDPSVLPARKGIIVYHALWSDATGHFDLWDGSNFVGAGTFTDVADGFDVALWTLSGA